MKFSEQQRQIALRKLKGSKRLLLLGASIAGVLGIWAPFYPKYLASAAILGGITGLIYWFRFRSPPQSPMEVLRIVIGSTLFMVLGLFISRDFCLPRDMSNFHRYLAMFQAMGILFAAFGLTFMLLGAQYQKDLENNSTPDQPPNL